MIGATRIHIATQVSLFDAINLDPRSVRRIDNATLVSCAFAPVYRRGVIAGLRQGRNFFIEVLCMRSGCKR